MNRRDAIRGLFALPFVAAGLKLPAAPPALLMQHARYRAAYLEHLYNLPRGILTENQRRSMEAHGKAAQ